MLPILRHGLFLLIPWISFQVFADNGVFTFQSFVKNKTAIRINENSDLSQFENTLQIKVSKEWKKWSWQAVGRIRREKELIVDNQNEIELREFRVNRESEFTSLILGLQQIVWGKTDGLRLLDIVNPMDLREFVFADFIESRIPVWALNFEFFLGNHGLQFLLIPGIRYDSIPDPGGEFHISQSVPPGIPVVVHNIDVPSDQIQNWETGFKWAGQMGPLDFSFNIFYGWMNTPIYNSKLSPGLLLEVTPALKRDLIYGTSADLPIGSTVLRGEIIYAVDVFRQIDTPDLIGGHVKQDLIRGAIGLDWLKRNWLISPQVFREEVLNPHSQLSQKSQLTFATMLIRRKFLQNDLTLRIFYLHGINNKDRWFAPSISYNVSGYFNIQLGADLIWGNEGDIFGQFRDRDRITAGATLHFK